MRERLVTKLLSCGRARSLSDFAPSRVSLPFFFDSQFAAAADQAYAFFKMRTQLAVTTSIACALLGLKLAHASDLTLVHARVYASPGTPAIDDATIVIHNDRIAAVQAPSTPAAGITGDSAVIDCTGMSVTAGLWNSHIHILPVKLLHAHEKTGPQLTAALQEMLTRWGFTTVFDVASILANTNEIRSRIAAGDILGPRILTTGEPFFPPHGIPSYVSGYLEQNQISIPDDATPALAVERVQQEVRAGANGIKIFAGSVEGNSVLLMPLERAQAIVNEAHRLNRPVFAHPTNLAGIDIALDSGVDVLAHATSDDAPWGPALLKRMRASHMALIPTLTLFDVEVKKDGGTPKIEQEVVGRAVARLRAYNAAGGEILFGTDVGYMYEFDTAQEYALMQRGGMSFRQILASLTTNPARRFGSAQHSGRIAASMDADLTVFKGDPAVDITALSRVSYTIRSGKVIFQAAVTQPELAQ
jgi:imidazolonepropionase-like amidohydrolase